jgi:DNA-binding winged helix-turn-helix (wHTH) protein
MADSSKPVGSMCFGPYELSLESEELRKDGQRLKLSGQAIQVLVVLANNRGELVTREELQQRLWPGATNGDFEHGLNAAVNRLRETLGDSATHPKYIETIPRRGGLWRIVSRWSSRLNPRPRERHQNLPSHSGGSARQRLQPRLVSSSSDRCIPGQSRKSSDY